MTPVSDATTDPEGTVPAGTRPVLGEEEKTLAAHSAIILGGLVYGRLARLGVQVLLGQGLGPVGYGLFAVVQSCIDMGKAVAPLGFDRGVIRYVALFRAQDQSMASARTVQLGAGIALTCGIVIAIGISLQSESLARMLGEPDARESLALYALAIPAIAVMSVLSGSFRADRRVMTDMGVNEVFHPTLQVVLLIGVLVVTKTLDVQTAVGALVVASAVGATVAGIVGRSWLVGGVRSTSGQEFRFPTRDVIVYSLALLMVGAGGIALRADRLILGNLISIRDIGLYGAAYLLSQQNAFLLLAINTAFAPRVAHLYGEGREAEVPGLVRVLNRWTLALSIPVVSVSVLHAPDILRLLGQTFPEATGLLIVMTLGQFVNVATGSLGVVFNMSGHQRWEVANTAILAVVTLSGILVLTPLYGVMGAAIAVAAGLVASNVSRVVEYYMLFHTHPFDLRTWKCGVAGAAAITAWWWLIGFREEGGGVPDALLHLAFGGTVVVGTYFVVMLVWGIEPEERDLAKATCRKILARIRD